MTERGGCRTGPVLKTKRDCWVLGPGNPLRVPSSTSGETAKKPCHAQDAASKEVG